MADVELVIKIPNETYRDVIKNGFIYDEDGEEISHAIISGTVLPEGHGRLIDADALEKKMCDREKELGDDKAMWESSAVSVALDMFAPTIIPEDRSEE